MLTNRLDKIEDKILDLRSFARNNFDRKGLLINHARFARRRHEWFAFTRRWPLLPNLFDITFAIIGLDFTDVNRRDQFLALARLVRRIVASL